jgi:phosphoglycolate phosphatase-like HAD superfamily hydrolase
MRAKRLSATTVALWWLACVNLAYGQADPLPSWNDGPTRAAIVEFVRKTTTPGTTDFVPVPERIAVFDNDGTLWSEQPIYFQFAFALDRIKAMAPEHPEWRTTQPFKAVLEDDMKTVAASGEKGLVEILLATHTGMDTDAFSRQVAAWLQAARHPRFGKRYTELVYQPMLELLGFLRRNEFKTYIVSGGTIEFMRVFAETVYGIPPEQVVGSSFATKYVANHDGKPALLRESRIDFVDDGPGKPVGIQKFIGRRPIIAFGNSDGDLQMLQWTAAGTGPRFIAIIHHTDAAREWAYDRASHVGKLDRALDDAAARQWTVVDMKRDWKVIYPP